jgi:hypothetical protein
MPDPIIAGGAAPVPQFNMLNVVPAVVRGGQQISQELERGIVDYLESKVKQDTARNNAPEEVTKKAEKINQNIRGIITGGAITAALDVFAQSNLGSALPLSFLGMGMALAILSTEQKKTEGQ